MKYPILDRGKRAYEELKHQAAHYDTMCFLVDAITRLRKRRRAYEVKVLWLCFDSGEDDTWEPLDNVGDDTTNILEDFLYTASNRNIKRKIFDASKTLNLVMSKICRAL